MSKQTMIFKLCKCGLRSWLPRFIIIVFILSITNFFTISKFAWRDPLPRTCELDKHVRRNVVLMETISKYTHGLTVGACAQDAVLSDLRRSESNRTAAEPYTGTDLLKMVTPPYSAEYKNPCWVDDTTKKLRCLPYFILAGIAKSGTTNLYWSIAQHPQVTVPRRKEPQWWATRAYEAPLEDYIRFFDMITSTIQKESTLVKSKRYHRFVTGDGSPSTGYQFFRWKNITQNKNCTGEPGVVTPHLIKHIIPQAKVIFILRNPADRLLAGYIHWRKNRTTNREHFHKDCVKILTQYRNCKKLHSDRHCTYNSSFVSIGRERLQRSMYSVFIKDWLTVFPFERMHFVQFEDFVQNKANVLKGVFKFLDLDPLSADEMKRVMTTEGINIHKFKMAPMLKKTRRMLEDFFKPYNDEVSILIGDPKFKFLNTHIPQNDPSGKNEVWNRSNTTGDTTTHKL